MGTIQRSFRFPRTLGAALGAANDAFRAAENLMLYGGFRARVHADHYAVYVTVEWDHFEADEPIIVEG